MVLAIAFSIGAVCTFMGTIFVFLACLSQRRWFWSFGVAFTGGILALVYTQKREDLRWVKKYLLLGIPLYFIPILVAANAVLSNT